MTIDRQDAPGVTIELSTKADRPAFLALPEGLYRVSVTQPGAFGCQAVGADNHFLPWGLPADGPGVLELPVLADHFALSGTNCWCVPLRANQSLVDLATCTFEPSAGAP